MSEREEFTTSLKGAITEKTSWFNTEELPKLLEEYRLLHTCVRNLYELLIKRSLITPDPYKLDKKISTISSPEETAFAETEASVVIGARFSDYESMLDFICTYFNFSVDNISLSTIKKLNDLNNCFQWTNMSTNNTRINTKSLASILVEARRTQQQLSSGVISDCISKSSKATTEITRILKELADFKREEYKYKIRTQVIENKNFNQAGVTDAATEIAEIKKIFPSVMGKSPFYSELVNEITEEDFSPKKDDFQKKTLEILKVKKVQETKKKETVNTKAIVIDAIRILSNLSPEYATIAEKLSENEKILEGSKTTLFTKLAKALRKLFNMKEPPTIYKIILVDQKKQSKQTKEIDINIFIDNLQRKANFLAVIADKTTQEYKKINASSEEQILQFLNKQISENNETLTYLTSLDEYFKTNCSQQARSKIKGLKIDLVSVKNVLVKSNQRRAEYVSYVEEVNQMKKLGIQDYE